MISENETQIDDSPRTEEGDQITIAKAEYLEMTSRNSYLEEENARIREGCRTPTLYRQALNFVVS